MFERFIVATDLSAASDAVVGRLGGLRALGARRALLLQCLEMARADSAALSFTTAALDDYLQQQKGVLEGQGFEVEARVVPGYAKREINRIAAEEDYALVVVGSHGHGMIAEALLGGVASEVLHGATRPVLVVRLGRRTDTGEVAVSPMLGDLSSHVLFPTDFSANADLAFTVVESLVGAGVSRVTLLHVPDRSRIEPHLSDQREALDASDRGRLDALAARLRARGAREVAVALRPGVPHQEILALAREGEVHLIAMGSQGRGFVPELFLGSVSHRVARHAQAPVLLIPAERHRA